MKLARLFGVVVSAVLCTGCSGGSDAVPTTLAPLTTPPSTTPPSTTPLPATTPESTAVSTVAPTEAPTTVTTSCEPAGSFDPVNVGQGQLSGLVGVDIRAGHHPCYERVVIELDPGAAGNPPFPGYRVEYVAKGDVVFDPSGEPAKVDGTAVLEITVGSWMPSDTAGYSGPKRFHPLNVAHIVELVQLQNFEGVTTWAVGLDAKLPFTVSTLSSPARLVVDVRTLEP